MTSQHNSKKKDLTSETVEPQHKTDNFNSDYYFDDIIKELGEAGFYSESDEFISGEEEEKSPILKSQEVFDRDNFKEEIFQRMNLMENNIDSRINSLREKVKSFTTLVIKDKTTTKRTRKELQDNILLMQNDNEDHFNKLLDLFSERIAEDSIKERAFEELYSQLNSYKNNFLDGAIKPFLHDLILLYDRMNNNIEHYETATEANEQKDANEDFLSTIKMYRDELLEIFSRNSIEKTTKSQPGEKFNPEKSNAVQKEKIEDQSLDSTIKEVIQEGFTRQGKILRPENVIIYKK